MCMYNIRYSHVHYNVIVLTFMPLQELNSEKSKMASVETRLSSELSVREQEITALHARMKASYDEHTQQTQKLNSKVRVQTTSQISSNMVKVIEICPATAYWIISLAVVMHRIFGRYYFCASFSSRLSVLFVQFY